MLQDVIKAIERLNFKENALRLVGNSLFVRDGALGGIAGKLREVLLSNKNEKVHQRHVDVIKRYFSAIHYYYIEQDKIWDGYVMECPSELKNKIPAGDGKLFSTLDNLIFEDNKVKGTAGIRLLNERGYVAEFELSGKYKISKRAFSRFVRNYRGIDRISLRDCLFEMYRCFRDSRYQAKIDGKLTDELSKLYTKRYDGRKEKILKGNPRYFISKLKGNDCIFVTVNNEVVYFRPNLFYF